MSSIHRHDSEPFRRALRRQAPAGTRTWVPVAPTGSMGPLLPPGAEVLLAWGSECEPGDLIMFVSAQGPAIVHRIADSDERRLLQMADHGDLRLPWSAGWISREQMLGRVIAVRHNGAVTRCDIRPARALGRYHARLMRTAYRMQSERHGRLVAGAVRVADSILVRVGAALLGLLHRPALLTKP